jgi:hypothetical protein
MLIYLLESRSPRRDGVLCENIKRVGSTLTAAFPHCGYPSVHLGRRSRVVARCRIPMGDFCVGRGRSRVRDAYDLLRRGVVGLR